MILAITLVLVLIVVGVFMARGQLKFWYSEGGESPYGAAKLGPFLIWTPKRQIGGFFKVDHDGIRYLSRWILYRSDDRRIFLHRIHRPDQDRHLHSHPWEANCLILWGGYEEWRINYTGKPIDEELMSSLHQYTMGDINELTRDCYHRIADVQPNTWSLVLAGPRYREWYFMVDGQPVEWRTYLNLPRNFRLPD